MYSYWLGLGLFCWDIKGYHKDEFDINKVCDSALVTQTGDFVRVWYGYGNQTQHADTINALLGDGWLRKNDFNFIAA